MIESGSEVRDRARLRNCIVMPGARVSGRHQNRIIGPDYAIDLTETEMQPSIHAREQKKVVLTDPLFAAYFGFNAERLFTVGNEEPGGRDPDRPRRLGQALLSRAE